MAQGSKYRVAIIGGGPAGCFCAYNLQNQCSVTVFEAKSPLATLLVTGGGRCNLAYAEYDFRELAKNYPRGEKFLYSVFSRFATSDTVDFFTSVGVDTYIQEDLRIFPVSNSSVDVRNKFIKSLVNVKFKEQNVIDIIEDVKGFTVKTTCEEQKFDKVVIAVGGHAGFGLAENLGNKIVPQRPALAGLKSKENFTELSGVCFKNVSAIFGKNQILSGDMMFTHTGITGPLVYKISSIMARENFPYNIYIDFAGQIDLQSELNNNPHKNIKNLLAEFVPKSFAEFILKRLNINPEEKAHNIDGKTRDRILNYINNFEITISGTRPDGEVVTSGGVDLSEINSKTMESQIIAGLYFCGEVIDVDGFCGGFNLQNCWSTAFVAARGVMQ